MPRPQTAINAESNMRRSYICSGYFVYIMTGSITAITKCTELYQMLMLISSKVIGSEGAGYGQYATSTYTVKATVTVEALIALCALNYSPLLREISTMSPATSAAELFPFAKIFLIAATAASFENTSQRPSLQW
jgi:hypothetical protein